MSRGGPRVRGGASIGGTACVEVEAQVSEGVMMPSGTAVTGEGQGARRPWVYHKQISMFKVSKIMH